MGYNSIAGTHQSKSQCVVLLNVKAYIIKAILAIKRCKQMCTLHIIASPAQGIHQIKFALYVVSTYRVYYIDY